MSFPVHGLVLAGALLIGVALAAVNYIYNCNEERNRYERQSHNNRRRMTPTFKNNSEITCPFCHLRVLTGDYSPPNFTCHHKCHKSCYDQCSHENRVCTFCEGDIIGGDQASTSNGHLRSRPRRSSISEYNPELSSMAKNNVNQTDNISESVLDPISQTNSTYTCSLCNTPLIGNSSTMQRDCGHLAHIDCYTNLKGISCFQCSEKLLDQKLSSK